MPNFTENPTWEPTVYQLEQTDRVQGGPNGRSNVAPGQLTNRTRYLYTFKADLASPTFTGVPLVPTAAPGTNTGQIASTSFVAMSFAPFASPALTGTPTVPTAAPGTSTTQAASTAFVATSFAPLASPALTGTPTVPTAALSTANTQAASTAFVRNGVSDASDAATGKVGEYLSITGTSTTLTTNVNANLTSLTLTAGDWDICGVATFVGGNASLIKVGFNTVSATFNAAFNSFIQVAANFPSGVTSNINAPVMRFSVSTSTTIYMVGLGTFSGSQTAQGFLRARRVR